MNNWIEVCLRVRVCVCVCVWVDGCACVLMRELDCFIWSVAFDEPVKLQSSNNMSDMLEKNQGLGSINKSDVLNY